MMMGRTFEKEQKDWEQALIRKMPVFFRSDIQRAHAAQVKREGLTAANDRLRQLSVGLSLPGTGLTATSAKEDIREYSRLLSARLELGFHGLMKDANNASAFAWLRRELHKLDCYALDDVPEDREAIPVLARLFCPSWWSRQLSTRLKFGVEGAARGLSMVGAYRSPYVSAWALSERRSQKASNRRMMENMVAENQDGDQFTLAELSDLSVSNPGIRRAELMVRMRGFEDVAEAHGHRALFLTITTPSRFHPVHKRKGLPQNVKWDGSSPRDAQKWLCRIWAQVRAVLDRRGAQVYGFRIAEPHHDGTPHWHLLLFMAPKYAGLVRQVIHDYARGFRRPRWKFSRTKGWYIQNNTGVCWLDCDGGERGADKYRTDCVVIDPKRGSATGYIAKYVAKNIDGAHVDIDHETGDLGTSSAERVEAWASTWRIRQFQQIGGPSVTMYRELRRIKDDHWVESWTKADQLNDSGLRSNLLSLDEYEHGLLLQAARENADAGDWAAFINTMGGPVCKRAERPFMFHRKTEGETRYGEVKKRLLGILANARVGIKTRLYRWTVRPGSKADAQAAVTWSTVNNCTGSLDPDELDLIRMDYERGAGETHSQWL